MLQDAWKAIYCFAMGKRKRPPRLTKYQRQKQSQGEGSDDDDEYYKLRALVAECFRLGCCEKRCIDAYSFDHFLSVYGEWHSLSQQQKRAKLLSVLTASKIEKELFEASEKAIQIRNDFLLFRDSKSEPICFNCWLMYTGETSQSYIYKLLEVLDGSDLQTAGRVAPLPRIVRLTATVKDAVRGFLGNQSVLIMENLKSGEK